MAHKEQKDYFLNVKNKFPKYFNNMKVLDVGSYDVNGNNRYLFEGCQYIGLDMAPGRNVDVVQIAHLYNAPENSFDIIISNDCFEHDMYYDKTLKNIVRLLKSGGMFLFTCKTTGGGEHGTIRSDGGFSSPLTKNILGWCDYYKNICERDIRDVIDIDEIFINYEFTILNEVYDLRFYGIKK